MKILLYGETGQLGWELKRTLMPYGDLICCDFPEVDFTDPAALKEHIYSIRPDLIVNAAAYTDVDGAEDEEQLAKAVNAEAPAVIAEQASACGAALLHYSTDYVFDGTKGAEYVEEDAPNPINVYGRTKFEGEDAVRSQVDAHLIFRTSWVYGARRSNFMLKLLGWAAKNESLRIVDDQVGSPTWCRALAETTAGVIAQSIPDTPIWFERHAGVYHLAGSGAASRFDWAKEIISQYPRSEALEVKEILPVSSDEFKMAAKRPAYTALNCDKAETVFGLRMPPWRESLKLALSEIEFG